MYSRKKTLKFSQVALFSYTHFKNDFISSFLFSSVTWIALMTEIYLPSELKIEPDLR